MPAVLENPSHLLGTAPPDENEELSSTALLDARLQELREPKKIPPVQSLRELWQVMKFAMGEAKKAQADTKARAAATENKPPDPLPQP